MDIKVDDLLGGEVINLLEEHLSDMYAVSPAESVHALDVERLKSPDITFFSGWLGGKLQGCVAIKKLDKQHLELKSMRTSRLARNTGVASKLLVYVLQAATEQGYRKISLETGTEEYFLPARRLYLKHGFQCCEPFAAYEQDPNSYFMSKDLN